MRFGFKSQLSNNLLGDLLLLFIPPVFSPVKWAAPHCPSSWVIESKHILPPTEYLVTKGEVAVMYTACILPTGMHHYHTHSADEETEAQRGQVACPWSQRHHRAEPGFRLGLYSSRNPAPSLSATACRTYTGLMWEQFSSWGLVPGGDS